MPTAAIFLPHSQQKGVIFFKKSSLIKGLRFK